MLTFNLDNMKELIIAKHDTPYLLPPDKPTYLLNSKTILTSTGTVSFNSYITEELEQINTIAANILTKDIKVSSWEYPNCLSGSLDIHETKFYETKGEALELFVLLLTSKGPFPQEKNSSLTKSLYVSPDKRSAYVVGMQRTYYLSIADN